MRKTKQQMLNMQAQLEHLSLSVARLSKLKFNNDRCETIGIEFDPTIADLDGQQNCNKYVWKHRSQNGEMLDGLTDYLPSWLVEYMLYQRGSLCGFIKGGALYILPYAQNKGINIYGLPNGVRPITFNGQVAGDGKLPGDLDKELPINNFGDPNLKATACILYDRIPVWSTNSSPISRAQLNRNLVLYQCEIIGRIKNQLRNIDKKVVFWVDSEAQKNQMAQDIREAYGTDDPFIIATRGSNFENKNESDTLQGDLANEMQSLFETWQSINSIRCMVSGIANGGAFEKKERVITSELTNDNTQTDIVIDGGLRMRNLFLQQMRRIYPNEKFLQDIVVEINEKTLTYEEEDTDPSTDENIKMENEE